MREFPEVLNRLAGAGKQGIELALDDPVWNAIASAREEGFEIESGASRAWLSPDPDALIPIWIERETPRIAWDQIHAIGFCEIDSTNSEAMRRVNEGIPEGTIICAEHQTAGKGRQGRHWFSPSRAGLYFSVILRPRQPVRNWPLLTHAAGVALVQAIRQLIAEELPGRSLSLDLKWPNDVLIEGKKVAGILLESANIGRDNGAAVLGVGINVTSQCVPEDLKRTATAIECETGEGLPRRKLLVQFLSHFQLVYLDFEKGKSQSILEDWKAASSMWNEVPIWVEEGSQWREVTTCGITAEGALVVRTHEGRKETVFAGDVRIRRSQE